MVYCHFNFGFSNTEATAASDSLTIRHVTLQTHFDVFVSAIENFLNIQSSFFNLQLVQPYPRIDKGVKNIKGQIDEYVNQPEK